MIGAVLLGAYQCYSIVSGSEKLQKAIEDGTVVEGDYDSKYLKAKSQLEAKESERREQSKKSTEILGQINTAKGTITIGEATIEQQTEAIDLSNCQIESTEALIDEIQSYLDASVLMQVAEDKPFAKAVYQVKIENEPSTESYIDPADQVVASYTKPMNGSKEIQQLLEKCSLTTEQLDELYGVGSDVSSNRVTVWAVGRDRAMAEDIKKVREKVCAIDKWIMKAEGRGQRPGDDEIIKTVAVSIANTAESGSTVALMTTLKENKSIEQIAGRIRGLVPGMQFKLLTEGVSKASNVDELSRCDAAVLLEERNATSMGKLTADVSQIRLFNKKVLGAIVL